MPDEVVSCANTGELRIGNRNRPQETTNSVPSLSSGPLAARQRKRFDDERGQEREHDYVSES
jgi:hypothetical protein